MASQLSIIIPAYNESEYIAATIRSLQAQSNGSIEILVVDNNSSDNTAQVAKDLGVAVIHETKQGYVHACIAGAAQATGELITFLPADAIYPSHWLDQILPYFKDPQVAAVYGTCDTYDATAFRNWFNYVSYTAFLLLSKCLGLDNTSDFNFIMRRSAYDRAGGYRVDTISPDVELGQRIKAEGKLLFRPHIKVSTSYRRFQSDGQSATFMMYCKMWWSMVRKRRYDGPNHV